MAVIKLFAAVREAAGVSEDSIAGASLEEVLRIAIGRYGRRFEESLPFCKVAVNGVLVDKAKYADVRVDPTDEVAFLPPVSGG